MKGISIGCEAQAVREAGEVIRNILEAERSDQVTLAA